MADRFILFWVYDDDSPYIIRNPPENLSALLAEWTELDNRYLDGNNKPAEWEPVNIWLKAKGVDIIEPADQVTL